MKRQYNNSTEKNATYFVGFEVEKTPAYNEPTLFVVGLQSYDDVKIAIENCHLNIKHIFFGANHSFNPKNEKEWRKWEDLIVYFLEEKYLCSLDIPINCVDEFHEISLCDYNNFIPQIRVPIPYIKLWNYNTSIKIDDCGFNETNPGVWCHSLHDLMDKKAFTDWPKYNDDEFIK